MRHSIRYLTAAAAIMAAGLAITAAHADPGAAGAQIKSLDCASQPEVVAITNMSQETQVMTGWRLLSDPPDQQWFDLGVIGALSPGETVFIEGGPNAQGAFVWSREEIFRDGDETDYARLVSADGTYFDEFRCQASQAPATPTPGAALVPDGGGPPLPRSARGLPLLAVGTGGFLSILGLAAVIGAAAGALTGRAPTLAPSLPPAGRLASHGHRAPRRRGPAPVPLWLTLSVIALAAAVALAASGTPRRRRG